MEIALAVIPLTGAFLFLTGKTALTAPENRRSNYRNRPVSRTGGLILYFSCLLALSIRLTGRGEELLLLETALLLYLVSGLTLLGLADDLLGDSRSKGFKGHFRLLWQNREISTGFLKAAFGSLLALSAAAPLREGLLPLLVAAGVIALGANTLNSLDLRPGRALKFFLAAAFLTLAVARNRGAVLLLMPFLAALPAYVPFEMKEDIMLGDSGAYLLGGALGFTFAVYAPFPAQLAALALLLAFQAFCERHSFSRLVRRSNILRFLDELGRVFREEEEDEQEP